MKSYVAVDVCVESTLVLMAVDEVVGRVWVGRRHRDINGCRNGRRCRSLGGCGWVFVVTVRAVRPVSMVDYSRWLVVGGSLGLYQK